MLQSKLGSCIKNKTKLGIYEKSAIKMFTDLEKIDSQNASKLYYDYLQCDYPYLMYKETALDMMLSKSSDEIKN